jgi:hypothetical protein
MKQRQSKKETPRTGDKEEYIGFRCNRQLKDWYNKLGGSGWARKVLAAAGKKEDGKS